jgi:hypothetical protein
MEEQVQQPQQEQVQQQIPSGDDNQEGNSKNKQQQQISSGDDNQEGKNKS